MNIATKQKASSLHKLLAIPKKIGDCSVPHAVHGTFCLPTFYVLVFTFCSVCIHTINYGIPSKN